MGGRPVGRCFSLLSTIFSKRLLRLSLAVGGGGTDKYQKKSVISFLQQWIFVVTAATGGIASDGDVEFMFVEGDSGRVQG